MKLTHAWLAFALPATLLPATLANAQVEAAAEAEAGAKVAVGGNPNCEDGTRANCIPAQVVSYAPFNLRLGQWDLEGTTREFDPLQFTAGINPDVTLYAGGATSRTIITANFGGGDSGFEWNVGGIWMFGGRLSFGQRKDGGLFARIGADAYLGGNSDFYHSHLELPRFELGYQLIRTDSLFLEVAGRGGLMLTGRHRVFDRTRDIGFNFDAGGMATLQMKFLRLHVDLVRIYEDDHAPKTPIDRGQLDLCGLFSRFALCFTASTDRGEIDSGGEAIDTRADFIGGKLAVTDARIMSTEL